jgi:hypothetical protein
MLNQGLKPAIWAVFAGIISSSAVVAHPIPDHQ